jgi:hypothetical protein
MTRKGMAYGRMRQIDKMSPEEFAALPEAERLLWRRTPMPDAQVRDIMQRLRRESAAPNPKR